MAKPLKYLGEYALPDGRKIKFYANPSNPKALWYFEIKANGKLGDWHFEVFGEGIGKRDWIAFRKKAVERLQG